MLDTCSEVVRASVGFGICEIEVLSGGWGIVGEEPESCQPTIGVIKADEVTFLTGACWSPHQRKHPCGERSHGT